MHSTTWKSYERRIARDHGGERKPVNGRTKDDSDVEGVKHFEIQAKLREKGPTYLRLWLAGIRSVAAKSGKTGIVVWKEPGRLDDDSLVFLNYGDWLALLERWDAK